MKNSRNVAKKRVKDDLGGYDILKDGERIYGTMEPDYTVESMLRLANHISFMREMKRIHREQEELGKRITAIENAVVKNGK